MSKKTLWLLNTILVAALTVANACGAIILAADSNWMAIIPAFGFATGAAFMVEVIRN